MRGTARVVTIVLDADVTVVSFGCTKPGIRDGVGS